MGRLRRRSRPDLPGGGAAVNQDAWLTALTDELRQEGDLNQMIWKVPEMISYLSDYSTLAAGDLIFTGTPAGVGAVKRGNVLVGGVDGVTELKVTVV